MDPEEYQSKIDDYLLGRMSEEERTVFESEAEKDTGLYDQLRFAESVRQAMISRNEKLAEIKNWQNEWDDEHIAASAASIGKKKKLIYWVSAIAAVFVAGLFILQNQFMDHRAIQSAPTLGNTGSLSPSSCPIELGDARAESNYDDIDSLIICGRYEEAVAKIQIEMAKTDSTEMVIETQVLGESCDELLWHLARAYIGLGFTEEAKLVLLDLIQKEGPYQEEATLLLEEVQMSN